ncbi:bifunctional DNA primase/polymerase-like protein [Azospirillum brasilense]|uniref:Bifunctional DNA primase/polymerase-like protein n=1 Tax=Azospirillum brasilense TaxID=192 RepID=A0A560AFV8_AZOBR|nr:bifunctional DNA primase/polymerase [Azospirillum brasilense]TWA59258.1 bifunctional DNA primase/polymerase-like protein [Azospirillum brasilense]
MIRTNLNAALAYARRGRAVFPVADRDGRKVPLTAHGFHDATADEATVTEWWTRWPCAWIGTPTGQAAGIVVLDIDTKNGVNGWDALEEMGVLPLADTWTATTPSGGVHVYFQHPGFHCKTVANQLGRGLDTRGDRGSILLPDGDTRRWDPHLRPGRCELTPLPAWLVSWFRRENEPPPAATPIRRPANDNGALAPYATAALDSAAEAIRRAPAGKQEATLNGEAFSIGTLIGAGLMPEGFARRVLVWAGCQMASHRRGQPWRPDEVERKVSAALKAGAAQPRQVVNHG